MEKTKKPKRRWLKVIICCVLVLSIARIIPMIVNPMRRPESMATNYVLRLTPLGTDIEDVVEIVSNHRNWSFRGVNYDRGFSHPRPHTLVPMPEEWPFIVGDKSVAVWGHPLSSAGYWPAYMPFSGWFFSTAVSIFWGFDEDGKLIEVYVWQSHSG